MKNPLKSDDMAVGMAMFSMFFGAGNIIFPLAVGKVAGDQTLWAMLGLLLTAAVMPTAGVLSMILFNGDYHQFFGRLGRWPGFILALITISLLGPLGSTPRCLALSHSACQQVINIPYFVFSALACLVVYKCCCDRKRVLTLLGVVLTPLLLFTLITIIFLGLWQSQKLPNADQTPSEMFWHGLKAGYNTMDLLAAFFFSSTILHMLRIRYDDNQVNNQNCLRLTIRASVVGACMLGFVYLGFGYLAGFHAQSLTVSNEELLTAITSKIAGPYAGWLVGLAVSLACLTTAIALICAFADFMHREVFLERVEYRKVLTWSLILTFLVSTLKFQGISIFLGPILEICYPGLIVLTFLNIAYKMKHFRPVRWPVFLTFVASIWLYFR